MRAGSFLSGSDGGEVGGDVTDEPMAQYACGPFPIGPPEEHKRGRGKGETAQAASWTLVLVLPACVPVKFGCREWTTVSSVDSTAVNHTCPRLVQRNKRSGVCFKQVPVVHYRGLSPGPLLYRSSSSDSGSTELEATYFAMGILLAFIGNVGLNVGTNLIALGHDQKAKGRTFGMLVRAFSEL